jgi:hypothetical protein
MDQALELDRPRHTDFAGEKRAQPELHAMRGNGRGGAASAPPPIIAGFSKAS